MNIALATDGLQQATGFAVYKLDIDQLFPNTTGAFKDFEIVDGLFPKGTFVFPFATFSGTDKHGKPFTNFYDAAFTEVGLVNVGSTTTIPEPRTWVMMLSGFVLMAAFGYRRHKMARNIEA
jgi:hypothetical protein